MRYLFACVINLVLTESLMIAVGHFPWVVLEVGCFPWSKAIVILLRLVDFDILLLMAS